MAGLLDFLQSASNSVAGNVSGPVDLLGMALRKLGIPVPEDALGSSQWMERQGLTRKVPQGAASLAGETFGLLAPIAAAAKAPQIAKGLLSVADNAGEPGLNAARRGQMGATVWHGSPHKFDKFDSSKIGTGEGAQAYGHGMYLAESPGVASWYAKKLSSFEKPLLSHPGVPSNDITKYVLETLWSNGGNKTQFIKALDETIAVKGMRGANEAIVAKAEKARAVIDQIDPRKIVDTGGQQLYKVDLPDEQIAKMLDWDKPLSQQAPEVQAAAQRIAGNLDPAARKLLGKSLPGLKGGKLYELLASDDSVAGAGEFGAAASAVMRQHGIPGIKYLAGVSRGAGEGSRNYVVFPGMEDLLTILERNGVPLR